MQHSSRIFLLTALMPVLALADFAYAGTCNPITASSLTLSPVDCTQAKVWPMLQSSGQFPDVFVSPGKTTEACYASGSVLGSNNPGATAYIGQNKVTITFSLSGFTTDFFPVILGGIMDNLGTVVTQLSLSDASGNYTGKLFTRDTIDFSQIASGGNSAPEEDVIVGGTNNFGGAKGTYRVSSVLNPNGTVTFSLNGVICTSN